MFLRQVCNSQALARSNRPNTLDHKTILAYEETRGVFCDGTPVHRRIHCGGGGAQGRGEGEACRQIARQDAGEAFWQLAWRALPTTAALPAQRIIAACDERKDPPTVEDPAVPYLDADRRG